MTLVLNRNWRWLACFLAGLLSAVLLSLGFSTPLLASTASSTNTGVDVTSTLKSTFNEVAASHLESNFYQ